MDSAYTLRSRMQSVSNINPIVSKLLIRSLGPKPKAAVPMQGSMKYRVSLVLMAVLLRIFGFHAGMSSMTNVLFSQGNRIKSE